MVPVRDRSLRLGYLVRISRRSLAGIGEALWKPRALGEGGKTVDTLQYAYRVTERPLT